MPRDMRTWEQLTPKERSDRLAKYDADVKATNASRRQSQAEDAAATAKKATPSKKPSTTLMGVYNDLKTRGKKIDAAVDAMSR